MSSTPLRHRIQRLLVFGGSSVLVLLLHLTLIHFPSTKTWELSCVAGLNWMEVVSQHGSPVRATNGRNSERLLALASLAPLRELDYTAESYPRWSNPESWASADEYEAFIGQERGEIPEQLTSLNWWGTLNYYLGPCETNELLRGAAVEAILIQPLRWAAGCHGRRIHIAETRTRIGCCLPRLYSPTRRYDRIRTRGRRVWLHARNGTRSKLLQRPLGMAAGGLSFSPCSGRR